MNAQQFKSLHHAWRRASQQFRRNRKPILERFNLTKTDVKVLMTLNKKSTLTKNDLAHLLDFTPSSLTRSLDRLTAKSLIEKNACQEDKRHIKIMLTAAGFNMVKNYRSAMHVYWDSMLHDISDQDLEKFTELLQRIGNHND
ncbi:MarR family winged helix-turn-helix transcriptional regulator [Piscirickettsia litoralis]|uniref:HTH marR-type domain-containing protein n=1 Tax=Piscirickettsia litoralis TaxID=1891921 RepID=A0ABX3A393_9GAMM|nr:MarR family winged helix-turn-helix transcriptional regulator [Piscirickettsia litoralis]ODN43303.1 hypothetical protein BGC07_10685 [Piscirickettsia litoralis]